MILTIYTKCTYYHISKHNTCEIKFKFLLTAARARRFRFTKQDLYHFEVLSTKTHTHTYNIKSSSRLFRQIEIEISRKKKIE